LEYSCVPVPSNPEALQNAKSMGIDMDPMRVWAEKILDGQPSEKGLWVPRKTVEQIHGLLKADKFISVPSGAHKEAPAATEPMPAKAAQPTPEAAPPAIETQAKDAAPKPVLVETRTVPVEVWKCPHCQEEIGEKGLYTKDLQTYVHRSCGGAITFPASSPGGQPEPAAEKGGATVKAGAVLSKANKDLLGQAKTLIDQVLASTEPGESPDEPDVVQDGAPPPTTKTPDMELPASTEGTPGEAVALPGDKSGTDPAEGSFLEIADTPSSPEATIEVDETFAKALQEAVKSEIQARMTQLTGRVD
ncbi:MAG: hypothetical protein JWN15_3146, partial [Firmicutes bacterium]|nr:hypothetical protein [Bacillota bacterium]